MTDWTGTTSYEYDKISQTTKVTDGKNRSIHYTWTKTGEKKTMTYPEGSTISYTYDAVGNQTGVTDRSGGNNTYTYDALGQVTAKKLADGAETLYTYDSTGLLTKRVEKVGAAVKESYTYTYDGNGNRTKETSVGDAVTKDITYIYDVLNQLTKVVEGTVTRKYTYDEFNNRSTKEETGKNKIIYNYNALNQLTEEKQGTEDKAYTYDSRGSLSQVQKNGIIIEGYTFDATGMLTQVVGFDTGSISSYVYDGAGNRVSSHVTDTKVQNSKKEYVIDTQSAYGDIIGAIDATETGNNKNSYFTYGKGLVSADLDGIIGYYRIDEKGTVTDILDKSGVVKASLSYDEFGVLESTDGLDRYGNIFAYTGHVYDESTGLYYAKARYYEAEIGRFVSEDSYEGDVNSPSSLNLYIYGMNNSITYTDPSGNIAIVPLLLKAGANAAADFLCK